MENALNFSYMVVETLGSWISWMWDAIFTFPAYMLIGSVVIVILCVIFGTFSSCIPTKTHSTKKTWNYAFPNVHDRNERHELNTLLQYIKNYLHLK